MAAPRMVAALAASAGRTMPVRAVALVLGLAAVGLAGLAAGRPLHTAAPSPIPARVTPSSDGTLPEGALRRSAPRTIESAMDQLPSPRTAVPLSRFRLREWCASSAHTGRVIAEHSLPMTNKTFYTNSQAVLSTDGSTAVTGVWNGDGSGNTLTAWDLATRRPLWARTNTNGVDTNYVALSANGKRLAVVEPSADWKQSSLRIVDFNSGETRLLANLAASIRRLLLSPDGKRVVLVTGGDDAMRGACHDIDTGKKLWSIPRLARMLAFTSDGSILFATERNTYTSVLVLDAKTGKPMDGVKMPEQIHDLGIPPLPSPDGRTVLLGDIKIRGFILWDYKAGKELGVIPAYSYSGDYRNRAAAFSRDGKTLFTTMDRLRRWDAATGKPLDPADPADGHDAPVAGVRYSADGREVYSLGTDQRFARWSFAGKLLESGKAKADATRFPDDAAVFKAEHAVMVFHRFPTAGSVPEKVEDNKPFNRFPTPPLLTVPTADGRRMLALSDISIGDKRRLSLRRWTAGAGEEAKWVELPWTRVVPAHPISPCGRWIILDGKVYSTASGKELLAPGSAGDGPDWRATQCDSSACGSLRTADSSPARWSGRTERHRATDWSPSGNWRPAGRFAPCPFTPITTRPCLRAGGRWWTAASRESPCAICSPERPFACRDGIFARDSTTATRSRSDSPPPDGRSSPGTSMAQCSSGPSFTPPGPARAGSRGNVGGPRFIRRGNRASGGRATGGSPGLGRRDPQGEVHSTRRRATRRRLERQTRNPGVGRRSQGRAGNRGAGADWYADRPETVGGLARPAPEPATGGRSRRRPGSPWPAERQAIVALTRCPSTASVACPTYGIRVAAAGLGAEMGEMTAAEQANQRGWPGASVELQIWSSGWRVLCPQRSRRFAWRISGTALGLEFV